MSIEGKFILECIGCRNSFTFSVYSEFPICEKCKYYEKEKFDKEHSLDYLNEISIVSKKEKIPNDIRWIVWERDNFTCKKCGGRKNLSVDHIYPESKGGSMDLDNLQTLCRRCNSKKGVK